MKNNYYFENAYKRAFYDRTVAVPLFAFLNGFANENSSPTWKSFLKHFPLNTFMFFFMIASFTFGPGYQPIAFFFFPGIILTVGYTRSVPSGWCIPLLVYPAISIGIFFAYAGSFSTGTPWSTIDTLYMIPTAMLFAGFIALILTMDRAIANMSLMMLQFIEVFFAFPMLWAGLWCLVARVSPFGDFGNWAYAIPLMGLDHLTVGVTWLFGIIPGGTYTFGMLISSTLYLTRRYMEIYHPEPIPLADNDLSVARHKLASDTKDLRTFFLHPIAFVIYIMAVVYGFGTVYSTFAPNPAFFYQNPIAQWAPQKVQMSCLTDATISSTIDHLKTTGTNSKFVIWSEKSITVTDQQQLINNASEVSTKYGVYLGISYQLNITSNTTSQYTAQNMFTLIVPPTPGNKSATATVGFTYQKAHRVPGLESNTQPGPQYLPYLDTPYGRVGAAIGFDFEFPVIEEAYKNQIAIMFQPVWNWGATGPLQASMNRLRAVENGFQLFRCASDGVSGAFDQFYRIGSQQITLGAGDGFVYSMPLLGRRWTLFRLMPDFLGIACMAVFVFWIVFLSIVQVRKCHKRRNPRVRATETTVI